MSRRSFTGQSNTLLNYFQSPKAKPKEKGPSQESTFSKEDVKENKGNLKLDKENPAQAVTTPKKRVSFSGDSDEDISSVKKKTAIKRVSFSGDSEEDISSVKRKSAIKRVSFSGDSEEDISSVKKKTVKKRVSFSGDSEEDISSVKKKTLKKRVSFSGDSEEDISSVKKKTVKKRVSFSGDSEEDISSVKKKTAKKRVSFSGDSDEDTSAVKKKTAKKRVSFSGDSEEDISPVKKKRARFVLNDSDSEDEDTLPVKVSKRAKVERSTSPIPYAKPSTSKQTPTKVRPKPAKATTPKKKLTPKKGTPKKVTSKKVTPKKVTPTKDEDDDEDEHRVLPKKKQRYPQGRCASITSGIDQALFDGTPESERRPGVEFFEKVDRFLHQRLEFLKPNKIMDIKKRRPDHPDYNVRTLYVPELYLKGLTPAMRQWWELKQKNMDCVLFFKVGKFYELYHMDAMIGATHLDFAYMKGDHAHSGFPEGAFGKMSQTLMEKGFKVARVEQTETPIMMADRCKRTGRNSKFDKIVKREVCQITLKGACVYGPQLMTTVTSKSNLMMAICEKITPSRKNMRVGICFVDTSIGIFNMAEFEDNLHLTKLSAVLAENQPALVLTEKDLLSPASTDVIRAAIGDARWEILLADYEFYNTVRVFTNLNTNVYFHDDTNKVRWPLFFQDIMDGDFFRSEYELLTKSFGACLWYLQRCNLDMQLLCRKKFKMYIPIDGKPPEHSTLDTMILDSMTINNMKLLGGAGSLQKTLDYCVTPFGKRLFKKWICRPLVHLEKLEERQSAIFELYHRPDLLKSTREILVKLPDIERQLAKIFIYGNKCMADFHPDSRAVFYESKTYSKRRIYDFLGLLKGFERLTELPMKYTGSRSILLLRLTQYSPQGLFLDLRQSLGYFKESFDVTMAMDEGKMIPKKGVDGPYDETLARISAIQRELNEYLHNQCKIFGCEVKYFGNDKKRYQLEIPEQAWRKLPEGYNLEGTKNGAKPCKRFSTKTTKRLLVEMLDAEQARDKCLSGLSRRVFEQFSNCSAKWENALQCAMVLDCLCSLAEFSRRCSTEMCMPRMLPFSSHPATVIKNGRHPCMGNIENFVPNDTTLGTAAQPKILILTGPNMGGKSTLMKQVVLLSLLAQIGCFVPAESCEMTMVDRIFTRIGASDNIFVKQSTFFVELEEARITLLNATRNSLVLIDELGRGTSTHDGNAIATAYLTALKKINCRSMFSTHYHSLVDKFQRDKSVQLGHMSYMVEIDEEAEVVENRKSIKESVTFLYKMAPGNCPKSFGFNVAKLAGLPTALVNRAREVASDMETMIKNRQRLRKLALETDDDKLRQLFD